RRTKGRQSSRAAAVVSVRRPIRLRGGSGEGRTSAGPLNASVRYFLSCHVPSHSAMAVFGSTGVFFQVPRASRSFHLPGPPVAFQVPLAVVEGSPPASATVVTFPSKE